MTTEEWDATRQLRRDRRAATTSAMTQQEQRQTQGNLPKQQAMDHSSQAMPSMNHSINHSSQEMPQIDHPDVIQRIQGFIESYLTDLQNVLCNICKESFPTISTDELGVCRQKLAIRDMMCVDCPKMLTDGV